VQKVTKEEGGKKGMNFFWRNAREEAGKDKP
jgi:hypothetical protein